MQNQLKIIGRIPDRIAGATLKDVNGQGCVLKKSFEEIFAEIKYFGKILKKKMKESLNGLLVVPLEVIVETILKK